MPNLCVGRCFLNLGRAPLCAVFDADDTFGSHSPIKSGPGDPQEHDFMSKKAGPSRGAHRDGMNFGVSWQMKKIVDKDFKAYFCLWISRDAPSELSFTCSEPEDRGDASLQSERDVSAASHQDGIIDERFTTGLFGEKYVVTEPVGTGNQKPRPVRMARLALCSTGPEVSIRATPAFLSIGPRVLRDGCQGTTANWGKRCCRQVHCQG